MTPVPRIVTVHGLWNGGPEAWVLRHRLAALTGRPVVQFRYPSVTGSFAENAAALATELEQGEGHADVVGHSLGGLLALEGARRVRPGTVARVVLLGAPMRGSATARRLVSLGRHAHRIVGGSADALTEGVDLSIPAGVAVGMIAGSGGRGVGRLLGAMRGVHDGTVELGETRFEGLADHLVLPVSHSGMLFSAAVARATADFLLEGRFRRQSENPARR
jgi:pimeloyl-ACP methyl ester carboxylesterase